MFKTTLALRRNLFMAFQRTIQHRNYTSPQVFNPNFLVNRNCCNNPAKIEIGKFEKHKFFLQFTCKQCSTRSSHYISKVAYEKGVVLVECPGCKNNHLIADNLKWFKDERTNIESIMMEKGETIRKSIDSSVTEILGIEKNK